VARSAHLFEQAVAIDSEYAPALSGLADVLLLLGSSGDLTRSEAVARAREAAGKAVQLDPGIGEAHAIVAYIRFFQDSNWAGAESEFRRAIQLDPSAPRIHRMYAQGLMSRGRFDEAIAQAEMAAGLEPAGTSPSTDLAQILCAARRYDDAIGEARRIVQQTAGAAGARLTLGIALSAAGHYDEAIPELQTSLLADHSLYAMARLGYVYGAKGDRVAAGAILDRLDEAFTEILAIDWSYRALVYAGMGDSRHAVDCMENSLVNREGDVNFIGVDPAYDGMRTDPRFVALRKLLGVP
jgi:tetratricopeptide (TPR) repeat protein